MTGTGRRKPDFIGVGVQRSGTTYLQTCLEQHPEIGKPARGLHFFSRNSDYNPEILEVAELDLDWYERQLGRFTEALIVGEFSVTYGFVENAERVAGLIREHYPETKILIALRNPAKRAVSELGKLRQRAEISKNTTVDDFVANSPEIIERGRYSAILRTYFSLFPREQVHVKIFEDMFADPGAYVSSLYDFLGVDPDFRSERLGENPNPSRPIRFDALETLVLRIQDVMRPLKTGPLTFLHRALKATGIRERLRDANVDVSQNQVSSDDLATLEALYREDVGRVEELLGRDLAVWR